jgi:hypothetical protein
MRFRQASQQRAVSYIHGGVAHLMHQTRSALAEASFSEQECGQKNDFHPRARCAKRPLRGSYLSSRWSAGNISSIHGAVRPA